MSDTIEKQDVRNLSSNSCKSYASVDLSYFEVILLREGDD